MLEAPASTELYKNFIVEEVEVRFVLPEGVTDIEINADIAFERLEDSTRYSKYTTTYITVRI